MTREFETVEQLNPISEVEQASDVDFPENGWVQILVGAVKKPAIFTSGFVVLLFIIGGVAAPLISAYPYEQQNLLNSFAPPLSAGHLLGTDHLGRDILSRLLYGCRISLFVSATVTAFSLFGGVILGTTAGYYGGTVDSILSATMDIFWSFPLILVAIILVAIMGPGLSSIVIGMSAFTWSGFGRIVRGEVLSLRQREFIEAARALGASDWHIFTRHIFPNIVPITLVMGSFYMGIVIVAEAGLSFVGLGAQPPMPSLGQMLSESRNYLFVSFWMMVVPGAILAIIVFGFNYLGDSLRDLWDPNQYYN
jgi:peptide/nickel transport system permease protein